MERRHLFHIIDQNGLKGTVVNRALLSLNEDSLSVKIKVHLKKIFC